MRRNAYHKKRLLICCLLILSGLYRPVSAQTYLPPPATLTTAPVAGSYYNYSGITLNPNFSFTAGAGSSMSFYIANPACQPLASSFSQGQNYVATYTPLVAFNASDNLASKNVCEVMATVQYFDGLGRTSQTVNVKGSADATKDLVQPFAYDQFGRDNIKYQPFVATTGDGSFKSDALTSGMGTFAFYNPSGSTGTQQSNGVVRNGFPSSETLFEPSFLNRTIEQGFSGDNWQISTNTSATSPGHTVKTGYYLNDATTPYTGSGFCIRRYYITPNYDGSPLLSNSGYFPKNQLQVAVTKDENWQSGMGRAGTTETYTDNQGKILAKKTFNQNPAGQLDTLATYYVYDDFGNLTFVFPPAARADQPNFSFTTAKQNNLCYQYRYDYRNRLCQKKIPGKGWEYIVYNKADQLVATQDSLQRVAKQWVFIKYDGFGRAVMNGIWNNNNIAISQKSLQDTLNTKTNLWETSAAGTTYGYTNAAWPVGNVVTMLKVNYYDGYTTGLMPNFPTGWTTPGGVSTMTKGLQTAKRVNILGTSSMLWDVSYYDNIGNVIQQKNQHYYNSTVSENNYDLFLTTYSFTNKPTVVTRKHYNMTNTANPSITILNQYTYDHLNRKLSTWEQITNGANAATTNTLVSKLAYNPIGQLMTKNLHSTDSVNFKQSMTFTYNERGWLSSSNSGLFNMSLLYNTGTSKAYNGNIKTQNWTVGGVNHSYDYAYDNLNRLTGGINGDGNNESNISYDFNGNILKLNRSKTSASAYIDKLTYTYNGTNQLQAITDSTTNTAGIKPGISRYRYDGNGNGTVDSTRSTGPVAISYNMLNLPNLVSGSKTVSYTYDAEGNKLRKFSTPGGKRYYISGIEFEDPANTGTCNLSFIRTDEGRVFTSGTTANYEYNLSDHLGNARLSFSMQTATPTVTQTDDYYPFGLEIPGSVVASPKNEYLYNHKELQEETGLYDYGARFYDPIICRWTSIDPLAEKARDLTPFRYGFNNPINMVDPNGAYEEDGHFWTVYLLATQFGLKNARELADAAEWPDVASIPTYYIPGLQQKYHTLTGGYAELETNNSEDMFYAANNMKDLGIAIHRLGDSYAHRKLGDESVMYGNRYFTGRHFLFDGGAPDQISLRPRLYLEYVNNLARLLNDAYSPRNNYDMFTFNYIANPKNHTDHLANDAIFQTEISILNGHKNILLGTNAFTKQISQYIKQRNQNYGSHFSVKTVQVDEYTRGSDGQFKKNTTTQTSVTED